MATYNQCCKIQNQVRLSNIDYDTNSKANQYKVSNLTSNKYIQLQQRPNIYKSKIQSMISGLIKSYSITSSMQKISPILEIKQILQSQDLKFTAIFDPVHITGGFSFPDTYEHAEKSAQFIHSFLKYSSPYDLKGHTSI